MTQAVERDGAGRWRMLFEHNPLPMWVFAKDTLAFLAVNDAAVAHYGWSAAEFLAMTIRDIRPADTLPELEADLAERHVGLAGAKVWRHRRKNGELLWVDITAHDVDLDGRAARLVLAHDVTARVLAMQAVRDSQARWERMFEASAIGIASALPDGRFISANPAFCALLGRQPEQVLGQPLLNFTHPDDAQRCQIGLQRLLSGEVETLGLEKRYVRPDGRAVWAHAAVSVTPAPAGSPAGSADERHFVAVVQDIDAQRSAEAALRASEERFRSVARVTADAIWDWHLADDSVWWSEGLQLLFGHTAQAMLPTMAARLDQVHPDDRERVEGSLLDTVANGGPTWSAEYRFRRSNGHYARVLDRASVIRDAQGQALRVVGGMSDLSERYALEAQLQQSQRLEAVGQLTGGVAHDFNNLLTVILGNADLLVENLGAQPALQSLALMSRTAAERGAQLTQRLLAFARKQALQPQAIDAHQLLAGMDALLRRTLPESIELELVRGAGLWQALADPVQLESALLNLVLNARDAMAQGGKLTLETANAFVDQDYAYRHADLLPGQYVLLSVSDTGSGMTAAEMARAFEPFFTTKAVGKGSGLGLSMVYGFAKQSRGHVKLYSEPGHGTTVRLYLPRAAAAVGEGSRPAVAHIDAAVRGTARILVVEDDELVRRHAAESLLSLGYEVLVAENGAAAMAVLRERDDIELLFTDVVMPGGMNGRQLAEAALALRPALKVLYTSGYTENAIVHHGRLDRGVQLLPKPYRIIDLARKVRAVLQGQP